jgi:hypothetical protein
MTRGPTAWDEVRQAFPSVPVATFWRWVREIKTKPTPEQRQAARTLLSSVPGAALPAGATLPAPIALTAVTANGPSSVAQINFMLELGQLMQDAKLLRDYAMTPDRAGVREPKVFADAARLRGQFLQLYLAALPELYSSEITQKLYATVIDTVASCAPEAANKIVEKLRALTAEAGFLQ